MQLLRAFWLLKLLRDVHSKVRQCFATHSNHDCFIDTRPIQHISYWLIFPYLTYCFSHRRPLGTLKPMLLFNFLILGCCSVVFHELHTGLLPIPACRSISGEFQGVTLSVPILDYQFPNELLLEFRSRRVLTTFEPTSTFSISFFWVTALFI
jgi:hypothetical protein